MKLVRPNQRVQRDDHLIPLINVIFLMLIFFMVVGRMTPAEPIEVEPPVSTQDLEAETRDKVLVIGADGRMAIGTEIVSRETLRARLSAWQGTAAGSGTQAPLELTLKADASITSGLLRETLDLLEAEGIERVRLLTLAAGDQTG